MKEGQEEQGEFAAWVNKKEKIVTFQSNEYKDVGQRSLLSVPRNKTSRTIGAYRRCMFRRGYLLRAM